MPNVVAILQARMGSSRLYGKPLKKILKQPLLKYQIERLQRAETVNQIVVATTLEDSDDEIAEFCFSEKISCFRGSELDVLDRYYHAAQSFDAEVIVRTTGDCPLIDPTVVDLVVNNYLELSPKIDYLSNSIERTYPRGLDVEIFSFDLLRKAANEAHLKEEREHVTLYFYTHPELFSLGNVRQERDMSNYRWTVDTVEDLELITKILESLYPTQPKFTTKDILNVLDQHPEWMKINAHVKQKKISEQ